MSETPLCGIVLAGGHASRLSGVDKPMLMVDGRPLLRIAVDALADATRVVVVGPQRPDVTGVSWAREYPPGSGPVAALSAGIDALRAHGPCDIALLAGDLAGVSRSTVARLRSAIGDGDGAVLVDAAGRRQWLIGVWRSDSLAATLPPEPAGASLRSTLGRLRITEVAGTRDETADVDTAEDLRQARSPRPSQRSHR